MTAALPLLLSPEQLATELNRDDLKLVDLCHPDQYARAHLPGAYYVHPAETQFGRPPAPGLLPEEERLQALVDRIGLQPKDNVVVYDDEGGGWAGRMMWLLHSIGFERVSLLDGGIRAWHGAGLPLDNAAPAEPDAATFRIAFNPEVSISAEALMERLGSEALAIWDARSEGEYTGERMTAQKNGHIPGAVHFEWTAAMDPHNDLRLKPLDQLRNHLASLGITEGKEIITHCQTHHRSGLTYALGRILGLSMRAYPGSWSEWGNHPKTPVRQGKQP